MKKYFYNLQKNVHMDNKDNIYLKILDSSKICSNCILTTIWLGVIADT